MRQREHNVQDLVSMVLSCHHYGFNVFCGPRIQPGDQEAMENLTRYIIRASFSQERMTYIPEESKVIYQSKDEKKRRFLMPWNGLLQCALMCLIRESKWCAITDITAMSIEVEGKIITKMHGYPAYLKQINLQRNIERAGHD